MDVIRKIDDDKNELFVEHAFEANRRYVSGEMTLPTFHEGALNKYEFRYYLKKSFIGLIVCLHFNLFTYISYLYTKN